MTTSQRAALRALLADRIVPIVRVQGEARSTPAGQTIVPVRPFADVGHSGEAADLSALLEAAAAVPSLLDRLDTAERLLGEAAESLQYAADRQRRDDARAEQRGVVDAEEYDGYAVTIRTFLAAKE